MRFFDCVPFAVANITAIVVGHTLMVTGDAANNQLTVDGVAGDATKFHLASSTDTINGAGTTFNTATGVTDITIKMLDGNDTVNFTNTVPIKVLGGLSVAGGTGANTVTSIDMMVGGNFSIVNGTNATGSDSNSLTNLIVNGNLTINNGNGDSSTTIQRTSAGFCAIYGNVSITSGTGADYNTILDTNIGHNLTVSDGMGNAGGTAGRTWIFNVYNASTRALIGGNVSISYLSGNGANYEGIWDTEILGNLNYSEGPGTFTNNFDGFKTSLPVAIHGNATIAGTGAHTITVGTQYNNTGMVVGKNFMVAGGNQPDTLTLNKLQVTGGAVFSLGDGATGVTTTDMSVNGNLSVVTGHQPDTLSFTRLQVGGNATLSLGDGVTSLTANTLSVNGNFSATSGNSATGTDVISLSNFDIHGNLSVNNGLGDTSTVLTHSGVGFNSIRGNFSLTNGTGLDSNTLTDTNVGHNLTVNNGAANGAGSAGYTEIYNNTNTTTRAVIGGNLSVSYTSGNVNFWDGLWDTEVLGNVTFNHGPGNSVTNFDGFTTTLPVSIHGNLTMNGTGANTVTVGTQYKNTGMTVGGNVSITSGALVDSLNFNKLQVEGMTKLVLGAGANTVTINDSTFTGAFMLLTGLDSDTVNLDTAAGSSSATIFKAPVAISLGAGADSLTEVGNTDVNQALVIFNTFTVHHGSGADSRTFVSSHETFPLGNSILYVV